MPRSNPLLIVFGGLPGSGKTSIAKILSNKLRATYLRIDTIEQILLNQGCLKIGSEGYMIAYGLAKENLNGENTVISDSVNPIPETRQSWQIIATQTGADILEIEVFCSDPKEHQRRVESRKADIPGHKLPTWDDVIQRQYDPWLSAHLHLDTAKQTPTEVAAQILCHPLINVL